MNLIDAMKQRRSVRSFDGRRLLPEDGEKILAFAQQVKTPYDISITWKLLDGKTYGLNSPVIAGTDLYIAGKMPKVLYAEEAFGYTFEQVVLYAETLGIGTTWIAGTMNRDAFEKAMELGKDEVMPCVSPLGYPAKKMALREILMRKGVKADTRLSFQELFFDNSFDTPLTKEKAGRLFTALEMVRIAPSAVNKQPWRAVVSGDKVHFYEKRNKGFIGDNGLDLQKIDLGIALAHFALAAKECGIGTSFEIKNPNLSNKEDLPYIASFAIQG